MGLVSYCPECLCAIANPQAHSCPNCGESNFSGFWPTDPWLGKAVENGRYFVERLLGQGGFGSVYEVRHTLVEGRVLAMKVLNELASTDPETVKSFVKEIKGLMSLDHPNVVTCYEAGRMVDGTLFVLMEKVDGVELSALVSSPDSLFSPEETTSLGIQIAQAMQAAHTIGLLHRDLKPQNIMMLPNRDVRVLDFGIAKVLDPVAHRNHLSRIIGTPLYMAPEQFVTGAQVGPSLDIYQCGAVLHFALTGYAPFEWQGDDAGGLATIITRQQQRALGPGPSPGERRPHLKTSAPNLDQLIAEMLSFRQDLRPSTFEEVISRLKACLSALPDDTFRPQQVQKAQVRITQQLKPALVRPASGDPPELSDKPASAAEVPSSQVQLSAPPKPKIRRLSVGRIVVVGALGTLPLLTLLGVLLLVAFFWERDPETLFEEAQNLRAGVGVQKDVREAVEMLTLACDKKHRQACATLGDIYADGDGVRKSRVRSFSFYGKACRLKESRACFLLGRLYRDGLGTKKSSKRAFASFKKSCLYKHAEGCFDLAMAYSVGRGTKKSASKHLKYLKVSCDLKGYEACDRLGVMLERGEGSKINLSRARSMFLKGCRGKHALACVHLGSLYDGGHGVTQSHAKARRYFKKGCGFGSGEGCGELGRLYEKGQGVGRDFLKAADLYEQACDKDNAGACSRLGVMLEYGREGIPADPAKAKTLYEKSCRQKHGHGCSNLGWIFQHSTALPTDDKEAVKYYRRGCELGNARGCVNVGWMHENGRGVSEDINRGVTYYKMACDLGSKKGCKNLELTCKRDSRIAACEH